MKMCERLPAKAREQIRINLEVIQQQLTANVPFVLKQFTEATTRVVSAAKHEIDQFAQHTLGTAPRPHGLEGGIRALAQLDAGEAEPEPEPELADIVMENRQRARGHTTLTDVHNYLMQSENKTQTFICERLAMAINGYLEEFEAMGKLRGKAAPVKFYNASARGSGVYVYVTYISYQGSHTLNQVEAERYLAWLDAGNIGRHFEALK
jgi:hypothetical protein